MDELNKIKIMIFGTTEDEKINTILRTKNFSEIEEMFYSLLNENKTNLEKLKLISNYKEYIVSKYNNIIKTSAEIISYKIFNMKLELALTMKKQDEIYAAFMLNDMMMSPELKRNIRLYVEEKANELNKRFTFDDAALINLIESSSGKNIQFREGRNRYGKDGKRVILKETKDSTYAFSSGRIETFTHNGEAIPQSRTDSDRLEESQILLRNYPTGILYSNSELDRIEIMKKLMNVLFENLHLCYDTYLELYINKSNKIVENEATLSDDSTFNFRYIIDAEKLPHILGIPKAEFLSNEVLRKLDIKREDNALCVLKALLKNQSKIIEAGGLIQENDKLYQMLPWEKIVLKTLSFMRGDFFRECFCLVKLQEGKSLTSNHEDYVSIAATRIKEDITKGGINTSYDDLLKTKKQSKDFIFRGFIEDEVEKGKYNTDTLLTGKAENIYVGKSNEKLKSLEYYRQILQPLEVSGGGGGFPDEYRGKIVKKIENELMNIPRLFSSEEQLSLFYAIDKELGIKSHIDEKELTNDSSKNNKSR